MSRTVAVKVSIGGRSGRRVVGAEGEPAVPRPQVPTVARHLALAHLRNGLFRDGTVRDRADLARLVGVSRARVTQVMPLLDLAPEIQARVLDDGLDPSGGERSLRALADLALWADQRRAWASGHQGFPFR